MLEAKINKSIDKFSPQITFSPKKRLEPWVTPEIKSDDSNCTRLYRKYKRNPTCKLIETLNILSIVFYKNRLTSNSDPQKVWAKIRNLGLTELSENTEPIFSLDTLNNYYSSVQCPDDDVSIPNLNRSSSVEQFTFTEITDSDVLKAAKHFKSESVGVDKISIQIINLSLPILAPTVTRLFNQSIISDTFPSKWKKSLILPLKKIGNPKTPFDYCPISLLCTLLKIKQIYKYFNFALYRLRYFRHLTDRSLRTTLVFSLVLPYMDYCSSDIGEFRNKMQPFKNS